MNENYAAALNAKKAYRASNPMFTPQAETGPMTRITPGTIGIMIVAAVLMIFILFVAPFIGWGA